MAPAQLAQRSETRPTLSASANRVRKSIAHAAARIVEEKPPPPRLAVRLGPRKFALVWCVVLFFHVFNAAYTAGLAYIYVFLRKPKMEYYVSLIQMMPQSSFVYIAAIYGVIGVLNLQHVVRMLVYSALYRQLVFSARPPVKVVDVATPAATNKRRHRLCICLPRRVTSFLARFARATSVHGHYFDTKLLLREIIEVASQTYQAHSSSLLVSKLWTNQLFGVIVSLNCIANTAVHALQEEATGMRRFLCTIIDLCLDFAWGFVFPGNIIFYYLPLFVRNHYVLPFDFFTSDTLFIKAQLDCRQFFLVSWTDAVTTVLPYLSMLTGLNNLKVLLQIEDAPEPSAAVTPIPEASPRERHDDDETSRGPSEQHIPASPHHISPASKSLLGRMRFMLLIPFFGFLVLLTSLQSSGLFGHDKCGAGCKLRMHPWFSTHCACSVLEINCSERRLAGTRADMRAVFLDLDARVLNSLIISHCPAFTMPPEIQRFRNLLALEFYNVTFVDWPIDAALTQAALPTLKQLYIARSPLGGALPAGLTHDTTQSLVDIEISASQLARLPDDLDAKWPAVLMLYVEFCGLREFPLAATRMALTDFSLVGNDIAVLPEELPAAPSWMYVYLDRNPFARLPDRVGGLPSLHMLTLQATNVSVFPPWMYALQATNPTIRISANRTRACADLQLVQPPTFFIRCFKPNTYVWNGAFMLEDKDDVRRLSADAPLPDEPVWY